jgi:predicted AAA+ superfamily ATPase
MDCLSRNIEDQLRKYQQIFPVEAILGPRQCGKSTLVRHALRHLPDVLSLDLPNFVDLNKLQDPWLFFRMNQDKIICLL